MKCILAALAAMCLASCAGLGEALDQPVTSLPTSTEPVTVPIGEDGSGGVVTVQPAPSDGTVGGGFAQTVGQVAAAATGNGLLALLVPAAYALLRKKKQPEPAPA